MIWLTFFLSAAPIVLAAIKLAQYGDAVAYRTLLHPGQPVQRHLTRLCPGRPGRALADRHRADRQPARLERLVWLAELDALLLVVGYIIRLFFLYTRGIGL